MSTYTRSAIKPPEPTETLTPDEQVRWDLRVAAVALVIVVIDQITKALIRGHFSGVHRFDTVPIFGNILSLEFDQNTGAAFSSFVNAPVLLGFLILVAVGVIAYLYWMNRARNNPWLKVTFGLIAGGAVGNLIDRVTLGYVTDFIHFQLPAIHFDFAIFNVADSAISVGVVLLAIIFWTLPRETVPAPGEDAPRTATTAEAQPSPAPVASAVAAKVSAASATKVATNGAKSATSPSPATKPMGATKAPASTPLAAKKPTTATNGKGAKAATKTPTTPVKSAQGGAKAATPTGAAKATTAPVSKATSAATTKPQAKAPSVATASRAAAGSKSKRR